LLDYTGNLPIFIKLGGQKHEISLFSIKINHFLVQMKYFDTAKESPYSLLSTYLHYKAFSKAKLTGYSASGTKFASYNAFFQQKLYVFTF